MANGDLPPSNPNLPWWYDGRTILLMLGMLLGFGTQTITSCTTQNKVVAVQEHQAVNAQKLDEAAKHAEKAAEKADVLDKKTDAIKDKADKIGSKVGASGDGK